MAIDTANIDSKNCPIKHRLNAELSASDTVQLNSLEADEKTFYQWVNTNLPANKIGTPDLQALVTARAVGSVTFKFYSEDEDTPIKVYYNRSDVVAYGAAVTNVPTTATTLCSGLTGENVWARTDAALVAGSHCKFKFAAVDSEDPTNKGAITSAIDVIIPPASPTTILAAAGNTQITVSWDEMSGAASYDIYYLASETAKTAAQILADPSTIHWSGTEVPAGTVITGLTNGTKYYVTVTATNPGGTSLGGTSSNATPSA
jgi:hypothetical protein